MTKTINVLILMLSLVISQESQTDIPLGTPISIIGTAEQDIYLNYGVDFALVGGDTLVIVDRREPAVYLVTTNGALVTTLGRKGMGPGEYVTPSTVRVQRGIIYVGDRTLNRITAYLKDGRIITTIPIDGSPQSFVVYGDSLIVGTLSSQSAIQIISASSSFETIQLLRRNDPLLKPEQHPVHTLQLEIYNSLLYVQFREDNSLITKDLEHYTDDFVSIDIHGPTVDARRRDHERVISTRTSLNAWIPFIAFPGSVSVLPTGHLLLFTGIPDDSSDLLRTSRGAIIDPRTGLELNIRIRPEYLTIFTMRCLSDNVLAGYDEDTAQIILFNMPQALISLEEIVEGPIVSTENKSIQLLPILMICIIVGIISVIFIIKRT